MDLYQHYLESAVHFLSYRQRSEKEVRDNLVRKLKKRRILPEKLPEHEQAIEKVMAFLKEQKFLNDAEFAHAWIRSRNRSKPRSEMVLKMELRQKGVSQKDIAKAFEDLKEPDEQKEIFGEEELRLDDFTLAKQALEKKKRLYQGLGKMELYKKAGGFLARRGFSWEKAKRAIDEVFQV